jgi:hypothetical protein
VEKRLFHPEVVENQGLKLEFRFGWNGVEKRFSTPKLLKIKGLGLGWKGGKKKCPYIFFGSGGKKSAVVGVIRGFIVIMCYIWLLHLGGN